MKDNLNFENLAKGFVLTLSLPKKHYQNPIAIILIGIPASGKSYLAAQVAAALPFSYISENSIESYLSSHNVQELKRDTILVFASMVAKNLISNSLNCIFDASLKTFYERQEFRKTFEEAGGEVLTVYFDIHPNICFERIEARNKKIMDGELKGSIMNRQYFLYEVNTTEKPRKEERAINLQISKNDSVKFFLHRLAILLERKITTTQQTPK